MNCSDIPANNNIGSCGDFTPILQYTSNVKTELPKERFKIIDSNKRVIVNFRCFSSPNGLIIEMPKQELFPPYTVELIYPTK